MDTVNVAMTQYIIDVLIDDLERLNDKLVKEDIILLYISSFERGASCGRP